MKEAGLELLEVNQIEVSTIYSLTMRRTNAFKKFHTSCQQKYFVKYNEEHGIVTQTYCPLVRATFNNPVLIEVAKKVWQVSI